MLEPRHLVTYWNNVRAVTMEFLRKYPEEHLGFRPVDTVFTALDQFQHLISSQTMFVRGWTTGVWDFPWRNGRWQATELVDRTFETPSGLSAYYSGVHHRAVQFLSGLPEGGGSSVYETHLGPLRVDAMVLYAIDEEIHHRAQLGIYMRMLGVEPPLFQQRYQDLTDGPVEHGPGADRQSESGAPSNTYEALPSQERGRPPAAPQSGAARSRRSSVL